MEFFNLEGIAITSSSTEEMKGYLKNKLLNNSNPQLWVTFNLDFFRISSEDNNFHNTCKNADVILPDGNGILHLLKAHSGKKVNRITGNDILDFTLELSNSINIRAAFIGSSPQVISKLRKDITKKYPLLNIVASVSPPLYFEKDSEYNQKLILELKEAKPDILFLAIGCPRQELWLKENKNIIGAKINIGVGAAFDFYTGFRKRSPKVLQDLSLEWLWRLLQEPKRLSHRYLVKDFPFFIKKFISYKINNAKE